SAPTAPALTPPPTPAPPGRPAITIILSRRPIWLWVMIAIIALAGPLLAFLLLFGPRSGPSAPALPGAPGPGPTMAARADLRVLSDTSFVFAMAVLGDTVWAATDGGLLRYGPDGKGRVFTTADGLPFNETWALIAAPDGSLWA